MEIGSKLRSRRAELGLSRNQLAEKLRISPSAIANYENGISYPKPEILISLMGALNIDANYLFQDSITNHRIESLYGQALSPEEQSAIQKYRELSAESKRLVRVIISEEYERCRTREWVEFSCIQPGRRRMHCGFLLREGAPTDKIRVKKKHMIEDMEFCFQIHADQYNPIFKKYDILALKKHPASHNEIGIFCLNGVYYVRTLYQIDGIRRLRALNVMEPDIEIKESDSLTCIGTVLGRVYGPYELYPEKKAGAE